MQLNKPQADFGFQPKPSTKPAQAKPKKPVIPAELKPIKPIEKDFADEQTLKIKQAFMLIDVQSEGIYYCNLIY